MTSDSSECQLQEANAGEEVPSASILDGQPLEIAGRRRSAGFIRRLALPAAGFPYRA